MKITVNILLLAFLFLTFFLQSENLINKETMFICVTMLCCTNIIVNTIFEVNKM